MPVRISSPAVLFPQAYPLGDGALEQPVSRHRPAFAVLYVFAAQWRITLRAFEQLPCLRYTK